MERDIGWRVALLHSMKMVHRDIKVGNILKDTERNRYLLCDFGLSYAIKERACEKSIVEEPGGTLGYLPQQLEKLVT